MRAPVLATGRAFSSQRARAVSEKRKAARARARIHQNRRAHSVRIQNSDHACINSEFCMHALAGCAAARRCCSVNFSKIALSGVDDDPRARPSTDGWKVASAGRSEPARACLGAVAACATEPTRCVGRFFPIVGECRCPRGRARHLRRAKTAESTNPSKLESTRPSELEGPRSRVGKLLTSA